MTNCGFTQVYTLIKLQYTHIKHRSHIESDLFFSLAKSIRSRQFPLICIFFSFVCIRNSSVSICRCRKYQGFCFQHTSYTPLVEFTCSFTLACFIANLASHIRRPKSANDEKIKQNHLQSNAHNWIIHSCTCVCVCIYN